LLIFGCGAVSHASIGVCLGAVRASIPRPASAACDLELRASDAQKIDSNTLKVRVP
jgi:hypothetical protein